jgi:hypothetical protein
MPENKPGSIELIDDNPYGKEILMMFRHPGNPQADLESIKILLDEGWVLFGLNDDKAYFR